MDTRSKQRIEKQLHGGVERANKKSASTFEKKLSPDEKKQIRDALKTKKK